VEALRTLRRLPPSTTRGRQGARKAKLAAEEAGEAGADATWDQLMSA
jgi:CRP/FNR family transcriptional regulator